MGQHYTRNTVSASGWCKAEGKFTQHRIDDRRMGPCLDCLAKQLPPAPAKEEVKQASLFQEERER